MVSRIKEISFSLLPPQTVKAMAKVRVVVSDLYDQDGFPVEGGVMDPRMGVIDPGLQCRTCGGGIGTCLGHFGYLELAKPIISVLFTKAVYQLLRFTCKKCSRVMLEDATPDFFDRLLLPPQKCPHCKAKQEKILFVKPYTFYEDKDELDPLKIRERFEKIPEKDLRNISFRGGRPEWMIITLFPIPPVTMRPSITLEGGERSEDDLTHKLVDIVRINQSLKENIDIGAPEFILNDLWELVQYHISTYYDNELTGTPLARHRSGRALKGLIQRMRAKEGRIRGNLLGKRVNFSARTVISPDPRLSINEVGVPLSIAAELTVPLHITALNMEFAKGLLRQDRVNYVVRPDSRRIKVTIENKKEIYDTITDGWIIDRQLQDNDIVIFNRQPSLHRVSIMAHRARIMPFQTFRMNPSVCFPYNADFDGDEMNLHVPQTEEARAEASLLMEVQNNIISPKFGGPVIGMTLDQTSGIYMLTGADVRFTKPEAAQLLASAGVDLDLPDKVEFTGKELFSLLLPRNLTMDFDTHFGKRQDLSREEKIRRDFWVVIRNGVLESGRIDKAAVGPEDGKITRKLETLVGGEGVKQFIDRAGRLGIAYVMKRGFTLGIADLDLTPKVQAAITEEIARIQGSANQLITDYEKGIRKVLPGLTPGESLEAQIMNTLSKGVGKVSEIVKENIQPSDIIVMASSGSKGSFINMTQMAAVVGQETIMGKRIKRGYLRRTLAHLTPEDLSPMAHGFVARGFKQGLTPFEFFWNIMNGREGLMDKSLRTRKSGYMQRRLVNALQDLKVYPDHSVRSAESQIIQFTAGEDGVDPAKSFWGKVQIQGVEKE
ncbi:MAG: DNA-directed RNA polymerase subunit A' [Candidatus Aenigmarchaeota archaeon]|nr:DNA-directed RNA polymerase subunit A' [Candidatus Aenigmarchaeota archaeon]